MKRSILAAVLLASLAPVYASPSNDDLVVYHARLQVYVGMKQSPEQIVVSLGNYFGRQGNFQTRNNPDGTVDVVYQEGDGNMIRFIATIARLKPDYVEVPL